MAEVERDPACVERWPGAASGEYDPRCCRFPKSCSADLPAVDPEVEHLARVCADADAGSPQPHPIDNDRRIAAAVLADLRERYILVPRDGAEERIRDARTGITFSPEQWAEYLEDELVLGVSKGRRIRRVISGPWESWEPAP